MYYKCHKINSNRGGSYIDSLDWIKEKAAINQINEKFDKCFPMFFMLNHKEIKNDLQRLTKIKPFINKYNWERINFPSEKHDWKIFLKNNVTVAFNVFMLKKKKSILPLFQIIAQVVKNKLFF